MDVNQMMYFEDDNSGNQKDVDLIFDAKKKRFLTANS